MEGTAQGSRKRSYVPGAPIATKKKKPAHIRRPPPTCVNMHALHGILCEVVTDIISRDRLPYRVAMLSMVNRQFRAHIAGNFQLWYRMYLQWKGLTRNSHVGPIKTARGSLILYPTIPRSFPNFRELFQPHR